MLASETAKQCSSYAKTAETDCHSAPLLLAHLLAIFVGVGNLGTDGTFLRIRTMGLHLCIMARFPRVVATGLPHHVTQRGNARRVIFESDADRLVYPNSSKLIAGSTSFPCSDSV